MRRTENKNKRIAWLIKASRLLNTIIMKNTLQILFCHVLSSDYFHFNIVPRLFLLLLHPNNNWMTEIACVPERKWVFSAGFNQINIQRHFIFLYRIFVVVGCLHYRINSECCCCYFLENGNEFTTSKMNLNKFFVIHF